VLLAGRTLVIFWWCVAGCDGGWTRSPFHEFFGVTIPVRSTEYGESRMRTSVALLALSAHRMVVPLQPFFLPLADIADVAQRSLVAGPRPGQHPTAQSLTVTFLTGLYSVLAQPPLDFREYEIRLNAYVRDE
jgi:hypothetical protein